MRILLFSQSISPNIGGIESSTDVLAEGWIELGMRVLVVTPGIEKNTEPRAYEVLSAPTARQLWGAIRHSDVVVHNNPVTRYMWAELLMRKRTLVILQTWLRKNEDVIGVKNWCKRTLVRIASERTFVSEVLASDLPRVSGVVIHNAYNTHYFYPPSPADGIKRSGMLFVGRLVDDKGVGDLLHAYAKSFPPEDRPRLTLAGTGPEELTLRGLVSDLGLQDSVIFAGAVSPDRCGELMREHRLVLAPSRWIEPYGIVALEAAACGCFVVVPDGTGLVEAGGPAAVVYRRKDVDDLSRVLPHAYARKTPLPGDWDNHLASRTSSAVAAQYLAILQRLAAR